MTRAGWALLGALGALVLVNVPVLGSDPWTFVGFRVRDGGPLGPLVGAAGDEWDLGIIRACALLAGVLVALAAAASWRVPLGTFADGSGLSAYDRQSAAGEVAWLRAAETTSAGTIFRAALPVGCRDGTLRERFCGTAASGRVSAKTGTLRGVRTLAGYTTTRSGRRVWFSFMLSGASSSSEARNAIDRAVVQLAAFTG